MTAGADIDAGQWKGRPDLLSADEERTLSEIREIVSCIRVERGIADLRSVIDGVTRAGASAVGDGQDPVMFKRGSVRFTLCPVPDGRFEVRFPFEGS